MMKRMSSIVAACMLTSALSYAAVTVVPQHGATDKTEELGLMLNVLEQHGFTADQIVALLQGSDVAQNVHIDALLALLEPQYMASADVFRQILERVQENPVCFATALAVLVGSGVVLYKRDAIKATFASALERFSRKKVVAAEEIIAAVDINSSCDSDYCKKDN